MTLGWIPPIPPGTLLAENSDVCPDCVAGIRFIRDLDGRPLLQVEHDPSCPTFAVMERDGRTGPVAADSPERTSAG